MKTSTFILAASAALVAAQDIKPYIPECSQKCLQDAAGSVTTCTLEPLDGKCLCETTTFEKIFSAAVNCVLTACGQETALNVVLPGTKQYCSDVAAAPASSSTSAAPVSSSTAAPVSSSSAAATTAAPVTTSSSAAPVSSSSSAAGMTTTSKAASSASSSAATSATSSKAAGNGTATSATGSASSTAVLAGASSASAGFVGMIAAVGLGVFGLL